MSLALLFFFFKGLIIGLTIAAPVGPVGVLCVHRTLRYGKLVGVISGLGAAFADLFYGAVAAFGLVAITNLITNSSTAIRLVGGLLFMAIGVHMLRQHPAPATESDDETINRHKPGLLTACFSTFVLTVMNPGTIVAFTVIFATFGINHKANVVDAALLVLGVFIGSAIWWCGLAFCANAMRTYVEKHTQLISKISGTIIVTFGCLSLLSLIVEL
ncbi:LysE family transporter [Halodesulfovibrio sp.]|jgi:threonine/homoserine/homoserine lactone efflux protein|uniref:LysE family translocator n=1 Tax=Halodesulfovibrio sp. TaxID=1912772 RepID=UPI0025D82444|nr:LysE family transporter [Halodesulfovibrio sp.]MCT4534480.1 LysE family transporter [Halodesulfovibrio sp.]MCT4625978.1 LysE family transporter [Halodesulfovibrio sp.]